VSVSCLQTSTGVVWSLKKESDRFLRVIPPFDEAEGGIGGEPAAVRSACDLDLNDSEGELAEEEDAEEEDVVDRPEPTGKPRTKRPDRLNSRAREERKS